ncbi:MAG: hypothetical protein ACLGH3_00070 [Actinomycetota bacterium]
MKTRSLTVALGLALIASACSSTTNQPDLPENVLKVAAVDYGFQITGEPVSGLTTVEFSNEGEELHHGIIGKIGDGKTKADVMDFLENGGDGPPPEWYDESPIDIGVVDPGRTQTVQIDLAEAGTYVFLCFMPTKGGGPPHAFKGMVETFEIAEGPSEDGPLVTDTMVELTEYEVKMDEEIPSGRVSLEVRNAGTEPHDLVVVQIDEGVTGAEIDQYFEGGLQGESPIRFFAGTHEFEPGRTVRLEFDLEPGTYQFLCSVETDDGKKHADDLGMQTEVTVA